MKFYNHLGSKAEFWKVSDVGESDASVVQFLV